MTNETKFDIRKGDFVRVTYTKQWPGNFKENTADMIDWGFIVALTPEDKDTDNLRAIKDSYLLKTYGPFTLVISIKKDWLQKILVEHHPRRTFSYVTYNSVTPMMQKSDVIWKVKSDRDEVVLLVVNPRMEYDEDSSNPVWDKILKEDGSELTEEEEETYCDDLRSSLIGMFNT